MIFLIPNAIRVGWRRFIRHQGFIRAAAISFACLLATLPFVVLLSSIAAKVGFIHVLSDLIPLLQENLGLNLPLDRVEKIVAHAQQVNFQSLGIVGSIFLLISFISAMANLESNMNIVWGIRKNRNIIYRTVLYIPFLLILVGFILSVTIGLMHYRDFLGAVISQGGWLDSTWFRAGSVTLFLLTWTFAFIAILFIVIPYTKVHVISALWGSVLTTAVLYALGSLAIFFQQLLFQRFSILYGSLAVLPLIMVTIYAAWVIVLVGSGFSWALQRGYVRHHKEIAKIK